MDIKVGQKYREFHCPGHPLNKKIHIQAIVDESHVVFRWYGKHKQWWHYGVEPLFYFELMLKNNTLKEIK